jgi:hypothetical protein
LPVSENVPRRQIRLDFVLGVRNIGAIWYRFHSGVLFVLLPGFGVCVAAV